MPRTDDNSSRPGQTSRTPSGTELLGLGMVIALSLVLPALAGLGVDALAHSSPLGLLIGLLVGITTASVTVVMQFRRYL